MVSQVLTQLGRTPGAKGDGAGGAEDVAIGAGEDTAGGTTVLPCGGGAAELPS